MLAFEVEAVVLLAWFENRCAKMWPSKLSRHVIRDANWSNRSGRLETGSYGSCKANRMLKIQRQICKSFISTNFAAALPNMSEIGFCGASRSKASMPLGLLCPISKTLPAPDMAIVSFPSDMMAIPCSKICVSYILRTEFYGSEAVLRTSILKRS